MPRRRGLRPRLLAAVVRLNATSAFAAFMRRPPDVNDFLVGSVVRRSKHHTAWLSFALDEGPPLRPGA